jgi:hypothetical protein
MHEAAIADRREHGWKRDFVTQHLCSQITLAHRNCVAGTKSYVFESAAIFAQCNFTFGTAVQIIENRFGHSPSRDLPKIGNVHYP